MGINTLGGVKKKKKRKKAGSLNLTRRWSHFLLPVLTSVTQIVLRGLLGTVGILSDVDVTFCSISFFTGDWCALCNIQSCGLLALFSSVCYKSTLSHRN